MPNRSIHTQLSLPVSRIIRILFKSSARGEVRIILLTGSLSPAFAQGLEQPRSLFSHFLLTFYPVTVPMQRVGFRLAVSKIIGTLWKGSARVGFPTILLTATSGDGLGLALWS